MCWPIPQWPVSRSVGTWFELISFTDDGRRYTAEVSRTFEEALRKYFTGPLDDEDIAAITRIWGKLQAAGG